MTRVRPASTPPRSAPGQWALFAPAPRHNHTTTSRAAAAGAAPRALTCRARIHAYLLRTPGGCSHEEIARDLGIRLDTVKPRVHELGELGLVFALKQTRTSSAGAAVLVFVAGVPGGRLSPDVLANWPRPRPDWKGRAIAAEAQAAALKQALAEAHQRIRDLEPRPLLDQSASVAPELVHPLHPHQETAP